MRRFTVRGTNVAFTCRVCGAEVPPLANGSVRNHCPACLHSLHVDVWPGDRAAACGAPMRPIAAEWTGKKGWVLTHRCEACGLERRNRAALDDPERPDDYDALIALTRRP